MQQICQDFFGSNETLKRLEDLTSDVTTGQITEYALYAKRDAILIQVMMMSFTLEIRNGHTCV